jgi:hypothetical protein
MGKINPKSRVDGICQLLHVRTITDFLGSETKKRMDSLEFQLFSSMSRKTVHLTIKWQATFSFVYKKNRLQLYSKTVRTSLFAGYGKCKGET